MDTQKRGVGGEALAMTIFYWIGLAVLATIIMGGLSGSDYQLGRDVAQIVQGGPSAEVRPLLTIALAVNAASVVLLTVIGNSIRDGQGHIDVVGFTSLMLIITMGLFFAWNNPVGPFITGFLSAW